MRFKRILSLLASAAMLVSALCGAMTITASAAVTTGRAGNGVRFELDTTAKTLRIYKSTEDSPGIMSDYENATGSVWSSSKGNINTVTIEDGITHIGSNAFNGITAMKSVSIPESVTSIGDSAFYGCNNTSLTITLPSKLESIGNSAFYNNRVKTFVIPATVKTIGNSAFYGGTATTSITFEPESQLTSIGESCFYNNNNNALTSIELPDTVTSIGAGAFQGCNKLTGFTLPSKIEAVNDKTFMSCTKLATISIPATVKTIGAQAFSGCSALTSVEFAEGSALTSIGSQAFYNCNNAGFTKITLPKTLTEIGEKAFQSCNKLESFEIPANVTTIGANAFQSCSKLATVTFEAPSKLEAIPDYAFQACSVLATISLPSSVKSIGAYAFQNCSAIKTISIPAAVTSIGNYAYAGCGATSLTFLAGNLTTIGDYAFQNCKATRITLPDTVTTIGKYAFSNCSSATAITLSSALTSIPDYALSGCSSVTSINIPASVESIGSYAFQNCSSITSLTIPETVKTIGNYAFSNLGITKLTVPGHLGEVPNYAFYNCKKLADLTLEEGITRIGSSAFYGCEVLNSISWADTVETLDTYAFGNCKGLQAVSVPSKVKNIGDSAFSGCSNLFLVSLPAGLESISGGAFGSCTSLESIKIPSGTIGRSAFSGCTKLKNVTFGAVTSIEDNAFQGCVELESVTIPNYLDKFGDAVFQDCAKLTEINTASTGSKGSTYYSSDKGVLYSGSGSNTTLVLYPLAKEDTSYTLKDYTSVIRKNAFAITGYGTSKITPHLETLNGSRYGTLSKIEDSAFSKLTTLKTVDINVYQSSSAQTEIGSSAFSGCTNLETFTYKHGTLNKQYIKSLGANAFSGCAKLNISSLEEGLESIGNYAFKGCNAITSFTLPESLKGSIGYAFQNCTGLESVVVGSGVTSMGYAFDGCTSLTSVKLPKNLTGDTSGAFRGCKALTHVDLPPTLKGTANYLFQNCEKLTGDIVLPAGITSINNNCFAGCTDPDLNVYIMGTLTSMNSNSFNNFVGNIYTYSQKTYDLAKTNAKTAAKVELLADFDELNSLITEAKAVISKNYTTASYALVMARMAAAENLLSDMDIKQRTIDSAAASLKTALDGLVQATDENLFNKLQDRIAEANALIETDYTTATYTALTNAVTAAEKLTINSLITEIEAEIPKVESAINGLKPAYTDPANAPNLEDIYIYANDDQTEEDDELPENNTVVAEGVADESMAGATSIKFTIDCAADTNYNPYCYIFFRITFGENVTEKNQVGNSGYNAGCKGHVVTITLTKPIEAGQEYKITARTMSWWNNCADYVYQVVKAEIVKGSSTVAILGYDPKADLKGAIEKAEAVDQSALTEEQATALQAAIDSAQAVCDEAFPLPSAMEAAVNAINEITESLTPPVEIDKTALEKAIADAEKVDTSKYTEETLAALTEAVNAAKEVLASETATQEDIDNAAKAVTDAMSKLVEVPGDNKELSSEVTEAEKMDTTGYTKETAEALAKAIEAAKAVLSNDKATQTEIDNALKAVKDAVAGLKKQEQPQNSSNSNDSNINNNNGGTATVTTAPTTRDPKLVAKDKAKANKVKQAKISKLKVKAKAKKKITVTWNKVSGAKGYVVQVSSNKKFKKSKILVKKNNVKKTKITIKSKKLKKGKVYFVRVKAFSTYKDVNGVTRKVYSSWNKKLRKVKIK